MRPTLSVLRRVRVRRLRCFFVRKGVTCVAVGSCTEFSRAELHEDEHAYVLCEKERTPSELWEVGFFYTIGLHM